MVTTFGNFTPPEQPDGEPGTPPGLPPQDDDVQEVQVQVTPPAKVASVFLQIEKAAEEEDNDVLVDPTIQPCHQVRVDVLRTLSTTQKQMMQHLNGRAS